MLSCFLTIITTITIIITITCYYSFQKACLGMPIKLFLKWSKKLLSEITNSRMTDKTV